MQEILDAIDQLVNAISKQTSFLLEQSKGTVSTIQEKFEKRNERAKLRARQMREVGERWISSVKESIMIHTELAKVNAKAITEQVVEHLEARHQRSKAKAQGRTTSAGTYIAKRKQRWSERRLARSVTI